MVGRESDFIRVTEVAMMIGVSVSCIYNFCRLGKIPHYSFGSQKRFNKTEIIEWIENNKINMEGKDESQ